MYCLYKLKLFNSNKQVISLYFMSSKKKILQYIDFKGYTIYKFEKIAKLSHGSLKSGKDFTVNRLKNIRDNCPDLNMNWLIYDEGEMILKEEPTMIMEETPHYCSDKTCPKCQRMEDVIEAKNETIAILKHQLGIKDNDSSKAS